MKQTNKASKPFNLNAWPTMGRRDRIKEPMPYDIGNPAAFSSYHANHGTITPEEVDTLIAEAHTKSLWGSDYVPYGVMPEATRFGHVVEIE